MERRNDLVNIRVENLYPHPDNPRKDLGDITEITESVKKNGVMQNLTVIPIGATHEEPEEQADANNVSLLSDFIVLIGHRRLAAAKAAGIKEVPCKIVSKISKKEQVSIMLEENMQRSDLTIYEQAQGFQMMLDLGETAESIAKKTGFSQATVYHRLNLAKLDPKELKEKEENEGFQMSLKDLYELEKVSDIDTRNRLLKEARNSSDLRFRAQQAAKEEKRKKTMEQLIVMLEEKGIKPAPKKAENEQWSGKWDKLKQYDLEGKLPEEIKVQARKADELFYIRWYNQLYIIREVKKNNKISKEEQEQKEKDKRKKDLKSQTKQLIKKAKDYIRCIVEGKIGPVKETEILRKQILDAAVKNSLFITHRKIVEYFTGKDSYHCTDDEIKSADKAFDDLSFVNQMFVALSCSVDSSPELYDYWGKYKEEKTQEIIAVFDLLELYGWTFEQAMKYYLQGKEVIVLDRNSIGSNGKSYDTFPFEELFNNIEFLADVPAVENPEWNKQMAEMVAGNHPDIGEVTVIPGEESCGANTTKVQHTDTAEPNDCEDTEISTPDRTKETKKSIILELTEQGKTPKEIAEITGFAIQTIHQTRYLSKRGTKEKSSKEIPEKPPKEVVPGHNADRHLCKICKWRGKKNNQNGVGCEFAQYHDHTRGCAVEDCDVFEKGDPAKQKKPLVLV